MSSPQEYHGSDQNLAYYDSGPSPTVTHHSHSPGPPWVPTATADDQGGYSQSHHGGGAFNTEAMNYSFNHTQIDYPPQETSFQVPDTQPESTYNDNFHFDIPFSPYDFPNFAYHRHSFPPSGSSLGFLGQSSVNNMFQTNGPTDTFGAYDSQDVYALHDYRSSSLTQLPSMGRGPVPVYGGPVQPVADRLRLDVNTARAELANVGIGPHSPTSPVAISPSSQFSTAGPSRPPPGSPERKRLLPLSADDEFSTARNVVPRSDRAWSVHSTSSDSHRRSRIPDVLGRGPLIPQDRYTTSSVSSFNTTCITFDLENPNQTGVPIIDILNKTGSFNRIRDRTQAFDHMGGKKTFTLRVQWPGYKPWCKTIAALNWKKSRAPITRVKLAEDIATAIRDLLQKKRCEQFDQDYAAWNLGPNGIRLEQLCLVALHHVSKGSWQPQLCLLHPSQF